MNTCTFCGRFIPQDRYEEFCSNGCRQAQELRWFLLGKPKEQPVVYDLPLFCHP
jgi:hypothetical protein